MPNTTETQAAKPSKKAAPQEPPQEAQHEPAAARKAAEAHRAENNTPAWLFAAAKMKHNWPVGAELTAEEYAAALEAAGNERLGPVPAAKTKEAS